MKNLNFEIKNIYFKNKIVAYKIKNFININTCNFLKDYYYNHNGLSSEAERKPNNLVYHNNSNTYFIADDSLSTSISKSLKEIIYYLLKKDILLSYTFVRKYEKNVELIEHTDRESCEISVTLNIHHDDNQKEYFYISNSFKDEDSNREVITIDSNKGDAIIFFGMDRFSKNDGGYVHWRDPVKSENMLQLFCHYVYKDGKRSHLANLNK